MLLVIPVEVEYVARRFQDGNTLEDICEGMCPLYHGGAEAVR
ncbi:unnamed protein product [Heligmosomoides polygyrus]|uniref:Saposin B-type domain-containing protein n=1 Tax=Heligmosomoides polygyrus TaxID=6339 RepID=A0A183FW73_HELPZ|nr:unnamed protein product [Heligmosomoides polygyrus]